MKKAVVWLSMLLIGVVVMAWGTVCYAQDSTPNIDQRVLKKQCLQATITAINLEIDRHQRWIDYRNQQADKKDLPELQACLAALKADLAKYLAMDVEEYVLPEKNVVTAWTGDKPSPDSVLYVENMSKSGPWYHLAGVAGSDYSILRPNAKYNLSFYSVYPRSYWGMNSSYIFIAGMTAADEPLTYTKAVTVKPPVEEKQIKGEAYIYSYVGPLYEIAKCEKYQVYLLKDLKPGAQGELILDSEKSGFALTLSEKQMKEYRFIEFVSGFSNKIIKLSEIQDEPLMVIMEPEVYLKKPAIYLYPAQKSQITISHDFKGKLVNTYPVYTNNWTVIAEPNGNLLNVRDNRIYKYLFWDGVYSFSKEHYQFKSGFYVSRVDYVSFLQNKLALIGLNDNEINDFIVYWLPAMSKYKHCFVHFGINDNIDGSSILTTKPAADTTIRVFMEFTGIEDMSSAPKLPEQSLPIFLRKGFTLVEWGGAEIGQSKIE